MNDLRECALSVISEIEKVVSGKSESVKKVMAAILAGGHILLEDIPGVGKTTMALAFSKAMDLATTRMQFTPDVLPSDITGFYMFNKEKQMFTFQQGPIMTNLFLADEINRTSPKTQSALLEVMEEGIVTVDGHTMHVPDPFLVIATQNPIGSSGTQPLPESQLDRFMICISLGYPDAIKEVDMLKSHCTVKHKPTVSPIMDGQTLPKIQAEVAKVFIHDDVYDYILRLVHETRKNPMIKLGISPRGSIALSKISKSIAFLNGRDYCLPEDVAYIFKDIAIHRILPVSAYHVSTMSVSDILTQILEKIEKPYPSEPAHTT